MQYLLAVAAVLFILIFPTGSFAQEGFSFGLATRDFGFSVSRHAGYGYGYGPGYSGYGFPSGPYRPVPKFYGSPIGHMEDLGRPFLGQPGGSLYVPNYVPIYGANKIYAGPPKFFVEEPARRHHERRYEHDEYSYRERNDKVPSRPRNGFDREGYPRYR